MTWVVIMTLLLCGSCAGGDKREATRLPQRLAQAIQTASVVEALWLGEPEGWTIVGVAGRAVLQRTELDPPRAAVAKDVVLDLHTTPKYVTSTDLELPRQCPPDFAFVFRGAWNVPVAVATFDPCLTCSIGGLGQWLTAPYGHSDGRLAQLVVGLFPEHGRFVRLALEPPVKRNDIRSFQLRTGRPWPLVLP